MKVLYYTALILGVTSVFFAFLSLILLYVQRDIDVPWYTYFLILISFLLAIVAAIFSVLYLYNKKYKSVTVIGANIGANTASTTDIVTYSV